MSDDKSGSSNSFSINIFALLLLILSATGILIEPLISPRPDESELRRLQKMNADDFTETRLWQDPFDRLIMRPEELINFTSHKNTLQKELKEFYRYKNLSVITISVSGSTHYEVAETRRRNRFAVVSALNSKKYYPGDGERLRFYKSSSCEVNSTIPYEWFDKEEEKTSNVLVLWLDENKIKESDNDYRNLVNCLVMEIKGEWLKVRGESENGFFDLKYPSFKLIGPSGTALLVNLLKGDPIEYTNFRIFAHSATTPAKKIIQTLRADCSIESKKWYCKEPYAYKELESLSEEEVEKKLQKEEEFKKRGIIRSIDTDDNLATTLLWELWNRGINNPEHNSFLMKLWNQSINNLVTPNEQPNYCMDGLVLITELDTLYARSLANYLENDKFWDYCNKDGLKAPPIRKFTYLRGVDGILPRYSEKGFENQKSKDVNKNSLIQRDDAPPEHAEGRNQYDYLRRLADTIAELDRDESFASNGVKAIGILGSDVYDKLVILHALRERFKDKVFFTTDLDARYLHADQLKWTRNLIVASSFGLTLRANWQENSMPFRDSYQTSIYYSVLLALHEIDERKAGLRKKDWDEAASEISKSHKPQVFEIGRTTAISLNSPSIENLNHWTSRDNHNEQTNSLKPVFVEKRYSANDCKKENQENESGDMIRCPQTVAERSLLKSTREEIVKNTVRVFLVFLFIFIGYLFLLRKMGLATSGSFLTERKALGILVITLVITILFLTFINEDVYEPFIWSEGTSVWPNLVIRCAGILLILFICKWFYEKLQEAKEKIDLDFFREMSDKTNELHQLWEKYSETKIWWGVVIATLVAVTLTLLFLLMDYFKSFGTLNFPYRGEFTHSVHETLLFVQFLILWGLVFWVGFKAKACKKFIDQILGIKDTENNYNLWSRKVLGRTEKETGVSQKYLSQYVHFQIVVRVTERISHLIYLPLGMILAILIGRSRIFDQFGIPLSLIIVFAIAVVYLLLMVYQLRQSAEKLRGVFLAYYESAEVLVRSSAQKSDEVQLDRLLSLIRNERKGIYATFAHQPALAALLLPFGGMSGVQIIEFLFNI